MKYFVVIVFIGFLFWGCQKPPDYTNKPVLTTISITSNTVRSILNDNADALGLPDTMHIQIGFTDGNGAIGNPAGDETPDAFLLDSRMTPSHKPLIDSLTIPYITPDGNIKAISGTIDLKISQFTGNLDGLHPNWDTIHYTITIVDRNGNISNAIQTPAIYIKNN